MRRAGHAEGVELPWVKKRFRWENTSDGPLLRNFWVAIERKRLTYSGDVAEAMTVIKVRSEPYGN
jgi:hypothetical protein